MDVYFFLKQRTDLIRHFYDAASEPFVETKRCIQNTLAPFDDPPYEDSGEQSACPYQPSLDGTVGN